MKNRTVLLVEDDFLNRRITKKALAENNFAVAEAKNAGEALEILSAQKINLAILDINLGEGEQDGISLGQVIKDKYAIPFIYLTAYEDTDIINRAVITEPYSYLTKPFKKADLIASVEIAILQSALQGRKPEKITVKDEDYKIELLTDDINYIESDGNYILFHTDKKIYKSRSTIKNALQQLQQSNFVQVHRAFIVNKSKIEKFNMKHVIIKSEAIPVSKSYIDSSCTFQF